MMVYRTSDRIPVSVGELKFLLSPLSAEQKNSLMDCKKMQGGQEVVDSIGLAYLAIKYAVKGVEGLESSDGSPFVLDFDPDGTISKECVEVLFELSMESGGKLSNVCSSLINGVNFAAKVPGVEVDLKGVISSKKKVEAQAS
jgi:hypothetical protein